MLNIVLFGAPGCGKGTQSELLEKRFSLRHISTGNVIREHIAAQTELGKQMQECIERGELAPDSLVINMVASKDKLGVGGNLTLSGNCGSLLELEITFDII